MLLKSASWKDKFKSFVESGGAGLVGMLASRLARNSTEGNQQQHNAVNNYSWLFSPLSRITFGMYSSASNPNTGGTQPSAAPSSAPAQKAMPFMRQPRSPLDYVSGSHIGQFNNYRPTPPTTYNSSGTAAKSNTAPLTKQASFLKAYLNGLVSHTAGLAGGKLGTAGLLTGLGRLMGASSKPVLKNGKLVQELLPMHLVKGKLGFLGSLGQRIGLAGQKLNKWTEGLHKKYMQSLDDALGGAGAHASKKGKLLRYGLIGPTAIAAPIGYSMWADSDDNKGKLIAAPGRAYTKFLQYGTPLGLAAEGTSRLGTGIKNMMEEATADGASAASKLINYELANRSRLDYLGGVLSPERFATGVDDAVQEYLTQLNNLA